MSNIDQAIEASAPTRAPSVVIEARSAWALLNWRELKEYRDLFYFLVWRDIKVLYAQTILGLSWAILQPVIQIIIFTIVFGKVAKVDTQGLPYVLFSTVAIIPWTYMSQSITASSMSLVSGQNMLGKIYFPRIIYPVTPVLSKLVDFIIAMVIVVGVAWYYRVVPTWQVLLFPLFSLQMVILSAGVGMWLSAMAIRFRDVKHAMPFAVRMLMYTAPIVYSASSLPDNVRLWYSFNPLVAVIEGFRACLLGLPLEWIYILPGMATTIVICLGGMLYFQRMERVFVDVI
jgi:lipopolysaccharide transport system permease protein